MGVNAAIQAARKNGANVNDAIQQDLLAAHADALLSQEEGYRARYSSLFGEEMAVMEPLFALAEQLYALFQEPIVIRAEFRADLKLDLLAQARQQGVSRTVPPWGWAAIGASAAAVAGVIAAAAWRNSHGGLWRAR